MEHKKHINCFVVLYVFLLKELTQTIWPKKASIEDKALGNSISLAKTLETCYDPNQITKNTYSCKKKNSHRLY